MTKKRDVAEARAPGAGGGSQLEKPEAKPVDLLRWDEGLKDSPDHCLPGLRIHLDQSMTKAEMLSEASGVAS